MNETTTYAGSGSNTLLDAAATTAGQAIRSSQRAAHQAVDRIAEGADGVRAQTGAAFDSLASGAEQVTQRGAAMLRERTLRLREQSHQVADTTRGYIRDEPVKSMLIAAGAGAVLMGLLALLSRGNHGR